MAHVDRRIWIILFAILAEILIISTDLLPCLEINVEGSVRYISENRSVACMNCFLNTLAPEAFNSANCIRSLDLRNSRIAKIQEEAFSKLPVLRTLDLSHNGISRVSSEIFVGLHEVTSLDLSFNLIGWISNGTFDELTQLSKLNLSNNGLEEIDKGGFDGLRELQTLDLSDNNLVSVRDVFKPLNGLSWLDLGSNRLLTFDGNELSSTLFRVINLANNLIRDVYMRNIILYPDAILNLQGNQISRLQSDSLPVFAGSETVDLSRNQVSLIEEDAFKGSPDSLTVNLSHNDLRTLRFNSFAATVQVRLLDCSHNQISRVSLGNDRFDFLLPAIRELDLSHNEINYLPYVELLGHSGVRTLHLANNPASCRQQYDYYRYFAARGDFFVGSDHCYFGEDEPNSRDGSNPNTYVDRDIVTSAKKTSNWKVVLIVITCAAALGVIGYVCKANLGFETSRRTERAADPPDVFVPIVTTEMSSDAVADPVTPPPSYDDVIKADDKRESCEPPSHEWAHRNDHGGSTRFNCGGRAGAADGGCGGGGGDDRRGS